MQINRRLYLSSSPWGISLCFGLFWKRRHPKNFLFIGTNNWIALAVRWSIKYIFAANLPIFRIRLAEKREEGEEEHKCKVLCVSRKRNNILLGVIWLDRKYRSSCAIATLEQIH